MIDILVMQAASYIVAATYAARHITKKEDLLDFMSVIEGNAKAQMRAQAGQNTVTRCGKYAEKFARGWLEERQRQSQLSEIQDKVKSLADSIRNAEGKKDISGTVEESNAGKRMREAQLLSDIEELGMLAKKLKHVTINQSET